MSFRDAILSFVMRRVIQRHFKPQVNVAGLRKFDSWPKVGRTVKGCRVEEYVSVSGARAACLVPKKQELSSDIVLYLPGGAYVSGPSLAQWTLTSQLAVASGRKVILLDYAKAPEHCFPVAMEQVVAELGALRTAHPEASIVVAGDSAGAGLALGTTLWLRDNQEPLPDAVILVSPLLDVELRDPAIAAMAYEDPMLSPEGVTGAAQLYAPGQTSSPYVSPLHGSFEGLPSIQLLIGTRDIFLPDCRTLKHRLEAAGSSLSYHEYPGMFHVWQALDRLVPEAAHSIQAMATFLKNVSKPVGE